MPKRVVVILSVLVAIVLAGLAGYVCISWSTENPLRFRVISQGPPEMVELEFGVPAERMIPFEDTEFGLTQEARSG